MKRMLGLFANVKLVRAKEKSRICIFISGMRAWLKVESNHSTHVDLCIYYKKSAELITD